MAEVPERFPDGDGVNWDQRFLDLAHHVALWSKDPSTKVGAVIARPDKSVCSVGFNGFPARMRDSQAWLDDRAQKYARMVHAEINALLFARERVDGYCMYSTLMTCDRCLVQLAQAGIVRFVFPPSTADQLTRWGDAFKRSWQFAQDMGLEMVELCV